MSNKESYKFILELQSLIIDSNTNLEVMKICTKQIWNNWQDAKPFYDGWPLDNASWGKPDITMIFGRVIMAKNAFVNFLVATGNSLKVGGLDIIIIAGQCPVMPVMPTNINSLNPYNHIRRRIFPLSTWSSWAEFVILTLTSEFHSLIRPL